MGSKVLSLFDGMACGMLAMQKAGVEVDEYTAYEIDKYAIQTATHNFPMIKECGDVFKADFTQYKDIDYIVGGSPCFTKGHLVLTNNGYKDISNIKVGDMVLTHTGKYKRVVRVNQRESETFKLNIMGYPTFTTTANHPFYTIRRTKSSYKEYMESHTWRKFTQTPEWVEVKDLGTDYFCGQHITRSWNTNDYNIDEELAYILGRYVADGHIRKTKRKERQNSYQYQVVLSIGENKIDDFKRRVRNHHFSCYKHAQSVYRCTFSSMELLNFIETQGFGESAYTKNIPEFVYNLPRELQIAFLDGYISGDGCFIEQANQYSLSTVSPQLAFGLQRLITEIYKTNVGVTLSNNNRFHKIGNREIKANFPIYTILFKREMRKQSVAHIQNDIVWTQVKSVQPTDKVETVYNIEVEEDHSYTVNNCIVHNCTYWSIAQKNNRETEASGLGWELFSQYVRAVREVQPKFFIYENNKSMSNAIRESITKTFGFEPICINSALVSAQNRQRLYWVGKRNANGTYSKVDVKQPEDRGILLKDILNIPIKYSRKKGIIENTDKAVTMCSSDWRGINRNQVQNAIVEPVGTTKDNKSYCLTSGYSNGSGENIGNYAAHTLEKGCKSMVAEPVDTMRNQGYDLTHTCDYNVTENDTLRVGYTNKSEAQGYRVYSADHKSVALRAHPNGRGAELVAAPIKVGEVNNGGQGNRIYSVEGKSVSQTASSGGIGSNTGLYAIPVEFENDKPIKATSCADGKTYTVYEVKDGLITIKGKEYPIKLADGYYIIRKLTVSECKRLQTVPEWYEFPVSDTQAYKMLGNGWSVDVIVHLIEATLKESV